MGFTDAYLNQTKSLQVYTATCRSLERTQIVTSVCNGLPESTSETGSYQKIATFQKVFTENTRVSASFSQTSCKLTCQTFMGDGSPPEVMLESLI